MVTEYDKKEQVDNVYAYNVKREVVFIKDVPSGRNGYYCMGCDHPMQAVKTKIANRKSFFRHDVTDVKIEKKCTYSDVDYRQKFAKTVLQEIKRIKVPTLYKYPPKGCEGVKNLLAKSKYITAHTVRINLPFYEDQKGEIQYGKNEDVKDRYLLEKPDVTFFDIEGKPILFIELVTTHKPNIEKIQNYHRLGIDTVQVLVPKSSREDIEEAFKITSHTKWLYNYEESSTEYIQIATSATEGISPIDKDQRRIFEETISCRSVRINNLIRSIKRCLESEHYRGIEDGIRSEISRAKRNTEGDREQLRGVQDKRRAEIQQKYLGLESELGERERELREKSGNLETRYFTKKGELERAQREQQEINGGGASKIKDIDSAIENEKSVLEGILEEQKKWNEVSSNFEKNRTKLRTEFGELEREEQNNIIRISERRRDLPEQFKQLENIERDNHKRLRGSTENNLKEEQERTNTISIEFRESEEEESRSFEIGKDKIRSDTQKRSEQICREITEGKIRKNGRLTDTIEKGIKAISALDDIVKVRELYKRYEKAEMEFRNGSYKNWNE